MCIYAGFQGALARGTACPPSFLGFALKPCLALTGIVGQGFLPSPFGKIAFDYIMCIMEHGIDITHVNTCSSETGSTNKQPACVQVVQEIELESSFMQLTRMNVGEGTCVQYVRHAVIGQTAAGDVIICSRGDEQSLFIPSI